MSERKRTGLFEQDRSCTHGHVKRGRRRRRIPKHRVCGPKSIYRGEPSAVAHHVCTQRGSQGANLDLGCHGGPCSCAWARDKMASGKREASLGSDELPASKSPFLNYQLGSAGRAVLHWSGEGLGQSQPTNSSVPDSRARSSRVRCGEGCRHVPYGMQ